jgi:hypothetical protein
MVERLELPGVADLLGQLPDDHLGFLTRLQADVKLIVGDRTLAVGLLDAEVVFAADVIAGGTVDQRGALVNNLQVANANIFESGGGEFELGAEGGLDLLDLTGDRLADDLVAGEVAVAATAVIATGTEAEGRQAGKYDGDRPTNQGSKLQHKVRSQEMTDRKSAEVTQSSKPNRSVDD